MTTYIRTSRGSAALLDAASDLPRKMRTLLIAVDGRTDADSFVLGLPSFGDVLGMLEFLKARGYVKAVDAVQSAPSSSAPQATNMPAVAPPQQGFDELLDLQQRSLQPSAPPAYPAASENKHAANIQRYGAATGDLKEAVTLMCDFVGQHMALEALEISLELERLPSSDALIESLDGYEQLIQETGEAGQHHLRELRALLGCV